MTTTTWQALAGIGYLGPEQLTVLVTSSYSINTLYLEFGQLPGVIPGILDFNPVGVYPGSLELFMLLQDKCSILFNNGK